MNEINRNVRLIETDRFPFEFLSALAERESWRKEIHRPIYYVHKWWAKRLGSVFRGILLGGLLPENSDLTTTFYDAHCFSRTAIFDPFMGSGTTVGEAHKLGLIACGRDINPVAVQAVRVALGPMRRQDLEQAFEELSRTVAPEILALYRSEDSRGRICEVLYYFWVMVAPCPECTKAIDLFSSYVIASNAYPKRKPLVQILCRFCGEIFPGLYNKTFATCPACDTETNVRSAPVKGAKAVCPHCEHRFKVIDAIGGERPEFRLYAKLVLTSEGKKEYIRASETDLDKYEACSRRLNRETLAGRIRLPSLKLQDGYNTRQAIRYGFRSWRDFFNHRQLLALGLLHSALDRISDPSTRQVFQTLFSGVLEFNNLFASYKGEGTGAVRHMFAHHILKPQRIPIEANVWGTNKSSGSFSTLFRSRILRALDYRERPKEISARTGRGLVCSGSFSGQVEPWPEKKPLADGAIYLSCGDSARTELRDKCIDLVVTDPPFFDNVHYSELADFFHSWQILASGIEATTTRSQGEVQDTDAKNFTGKLQSVFTESNRLLKDGGLLAFTYHHSRDAGWEAVAGAVLGAGFVVVNAHPVKAEMSVAAPKSQAKEPIQLDIILVCRKAPFAPAPPTAESAIASARHKLHRLTVAGFRLSRNDRKIVVYGQLLATLRNRHDVTALFNRAESEPELLDSFEVADISSGRAEEQLEMF